MRSQGRPIYEYPNLPVLDKLVSKGLRFNRAYSYPVCSATRSSILTGRFGFRTGITYAIGAICELGLEYPQPTIPLSLPNNAKKAIFGKWHLRPEVEMDPSVGHVLEAGFEVYDGLLGGSISPTEVSYVNWPRNNIDNFDSFVEDRYFTSVITDLAIEWLQENQV